VVLVWLLGHRLRRKAVPAADSAAGP